MRVERRSGESLLGAETDIHQAQHTIEVLAVRMDSSMPLYADTSDAFFAA